jgi:hypothetical protein
MKSLAFSISTLAAALICAAAAATWHGRPVQDRWRLHDHGSMYLYGSGLRFAGHP